MRRREEILKTTTNRGTFNRAYKAHLEKQGEIHCNFCKYHDNENKTTKYYGGYEKNNGQMKVTFPNWKLVSKNRKQWMKKNIVIADETTWFGLRYIDITW